MSSSTAEATAVSSQAAPSPPPQGPAPAAGPVKLTPHGLHALALRAFRIGNRGRLSLCEALRAMSETRMYLELGFPNIAAYADRFFQLRRAEAYEYVRVATALLELTELREAFGRGELSWTVLKSMSRVASVATQAQWIAFAAKHGAERTLAEVRDAARRGRDAPRKSSFGLPNLDQKLVLRFPRSDLEKIRAWLEQAAATAAEKIGTEDVTIEQALLFVCERDLAGAAAPSASDPEPADAVEPPAASTTAGAPEARTCNDRPGARSQLVFQRCPDCRRSRMATREGFVEVGEGEIARYAGTAEPVVLEGPTPAWMRRQIRAREGGRCGNPRCGNRADHCHHIEPQVEGGETSLANQVALCVTCHALYHAGLLVVTRGEDGELAFTATAERDAAAGALAVEGGVAERLPVLVFRRDRTGASSANADSAESANADSAAGRSRVEARANGAGLSIEDLVHGLVRLGWSLREARERVRAAIAALPEDKLNDAGVLRQALSRR